MKSRWPSGRNLRWRKRLAAVLLALTALQGVVPALPAYAQGEGFSSGSGEGFSSTEGFSSSDSGEAFSGATDPTAVKSEDDRGFFQKAWEWIQEKLEKFAKTAAAVAYKQALSYFLKRLAVDTATQLAEGGKGKKPLYETEGWGAYLSRVGDSAAGHFIQSFAEGVGLPNLCRPKFNLKLKLSLGLLDAAHPPEEPACTFTQLADNWEQFIDNPPKLDQIIHDSFSPNQNDFGIGIGVWSSFYTKQAEEHEEQILSRLESQGLKPVVDIAGNILTPGSLIKEWTADALSPETLGDVYFTYTGEAVADAVNAFSSTLVSKMLQRLYTKGFGGGSSKPDKFSWSKLEGLRSPTADPNALRTDARQDFESFFSTNLAIGDPRLNRMDVTSLLVGDGVINQSFKTAIDRKLTVRQAIQEGLLFADGPGATFGYTRAGTQPNANEGYAHSALVILRKYRILPVGWELAAAYVGQLEQRQAYSLNDVIRAFGNPDSPFYGLVDDGWVLKAPETYCRLTGPGDKFTSVYSREETIVQRNKPADPVTGQLPSYQFERRTVSRENTCTDTRSCIVEDASGTCRAYGLCTQETPVWKFAGTQCPPQYDSCRSYEDDANRAVSYLGDTLDAGGCDANSVGCQWYCRDFNVGSGVWSCVSEAERVRKPCQQLGRCSVGGRACAQDAECPRGETCQGASCLGTDVGTGISCQIPYGAVACTVPRCGAAESFVGNSGFETESADLSAQAGRVAFAAGWSTNDVVGGGSRWQRISGVNNQVAAGNYAVRIDPDGTAAQMVAQSDPISVPAAANPPYTLTARIYSTLQFGRAYVEVVPSASGGCSTIDVDYAKGQWATVSCTTSDPLAGGSVRLVVEAVAGINPVGTVWFDEVRLERACPLQDVTVYLEGTQDADGSKLYFDRDISSCSQEESGCRALIPTGQGAVNLLYNSSFEAWPDPSSDFPPNWVRHPGDTAGDPVARETEGAAFGGNFLHYTDSEAATSDFRTAVLPLLQPGTTYQVAFFAKANTANTDWRAWLDSVDSAGTASNLELIADGLGICDAGTNPACRRESDCAAAGAGSCHSALPLTTEWQRFLFEPVEAPNAHREFRLRLGSSAASDIALDGVQIAAVAPRAEPAALAYADYISNPATYLKTPPAYLGCTGDPQTDHSACSRYSQVCRADEVGCERYTPTNGEPPLPGITTAGDQCPAACVDYSAFSQTATYFADAIPNTANPDFLYFIARTARACEARYAGCEQFTNLDEVARGGEGRGSYTYLRQCTKPDANVCRTYYTWVGSEVNGYQLKSYTLRRDVADRAGGAANGDLEEPDIAPIPQDLYLGQCVDAEDAASNPNCREFHATNGGVYYRLLRQTVACSDTCHPFRLIDSSQTVCQDSGGYWGVCGDDTDADGDIDTPLVDCLAQGGMQLVGGSDCFLQQATCLAIAGQEFEARNECIYQAVPSESISCPAAQAGCREYRGNAGGNLRTVFFDDFEDGDTLGWTAGSISSDAVTIGGHSISGMTLQTMIRAVACSNALAPCTAGSTTDCFDATTEPDTCRLFNAGQECRAQDGEAGCGFLRERITAGRNYQLTFWAKAQSGVATVDVTMAGVDCGQGGATCTLLDDQRVVTDWEEYTSPPILVSSVSPIAMLQFVVTAGGLPISVDFVALTEVQEYSYLIKNSWRTPQICDTDPTLDARRFPAPNSPQFALGCQEYATSKGQVTYLKSFERLCRDSSVGCEEFVDTKNSTSALSEQFNIGHAQAGVTVPADTLAYYVRDLSKECAASAEGCQAFGLPLQDARGQISGYQTRYLINDPERYGVTLCTEDQVGCREYVSPQVGTVYFRDPGARTCEYKQIPHRQDFGWFIAGSTSSVPDCPAITTRFGQTQPGKTCQGGDLEGQICTSDADCSFKVCRGGGTFEGARCDSNIDCGTGVCETSGGDCRTWVGQCPAEYASCTAYVDPMSDPQAGMLPNSNFEGFFRVCSHDTQTVCRLDGDCSAASGGLRFCANGTPCGGPPDCGGEACELSTCSVSKLNSWNLAGSPADHQRGEGVNRSSAVRVTAPTPAGTEVRQSLGLTGGTLYTVTASVKNSARDASIVVTTADGSKRPIFTQFDHSVAIFSNGVLAQRGDTVVLPVGGVTESAYRRFTGRFFAQESDRAVTVKITNAGTYDDVDLKPTGVYHYLADSIERSSCNGVYDPAQGCVLVNDTSDPTLKYSTSATVAGQPPSVCQPQQCLGGTRPGAGCTSDGECGAGGICRPGTCDSNLLVKVTPDRTCARWLDCISSRKQVSFRTGQVQEFCQQIATCDRLDPISGRCSSYPTEELQALTFDAGSVQLAQFFSGYAKVGFQWDADTKVDGYFPYGVMTQRKVCVAGNRGAACLEDADCHTGDERDGVCQPVLQVGANAADDLIFESCRVYPSGSAPRWTARAPVDTGDEPAKSQVVDINDPLTDTLTGSLLSQTSLAEASECHYVQGRSEFLGLYGFCVEKDPRSPYLCLNWLPVDELTGGWVGITGWRGNLRAPTYLCNESTVLETRRPARLERNHCYETDFGWWGTFTLVGAIAETAANYAERSSMECGTVRCPPGYIAEQHKSKCGDFFTPGIRCRWYCTPDQSDLYLTDAEGNKWYDYKAREDASDRPTKKHLMFCPTCGNTGLVLWDPEDPTTIFGFSSEEQRRVPTYWQRACHEIVQVVDDDGAQRGWQERLETVQDFLSADYQVPTLNYKVSDLAAPFGVIGRNFVGDPTKWQLVSDRVPAANFSHPFEYPGDQAGQVYFDHFHEQWLAAAGRLPNDSVEVASFHAGRERLKRLFATSYGDWRWNGSAYETYTVPNNYCAGGPRSGDSCAPGSNDCVDSTSVCVKSGGYCAYYPTGEPDSAEAAVNIPCSTDATCANNPKIFCATGRCGSFGDGNDLNDTETPCRTNADCPGGGSETCDLTGFIYGRCDDASPTYPLRGVACTSDAMCNTKSDGTGVGTCVGEDPDGQAPANGTYGFCSAGVNVLKACGAAGGATCWDAAAHQASCVGQCSAESAKNPGACMTDTECRVSGSCQATTVWLPPADRCRDNIRPSRFTEEPLTDPDGGGDWCGVSPEVFNVKIENAESPIFFGVGQTNITLSFNVKVDNDQLPLRLLRVRWDMENRDKAVTDNDWRSGLRDKSDPTDPFQFTHTYKYEQNTCDKGALAGGAPDGYCDFQVGITVRDNWCWCSNANFAGVNTTNLACNNCPDDLTPAVADDVNGAWVEARSARVRICDSARPELCGR